MRRVAACNPPVTLIKLSFKQSPCLMIKALRGFLICKLFVIMKLQNMQKVAFCIFFGDGVCLGLNV